MRCLHDWPPCRYLVLGFSKSEGVFVIGNAAFFIFISHFMTCKQLLLDYCERRYFRTAKFSRFKPKEACSCVNSICSII